MVKRDLIRVLVCFCLLLGMGSYAKAQHVSGHITDSLGAPIFKAYVMEMDVNHRILNQTTTDKSGNFVMAVTNTNGGYLRITADGFVTMRDRVMQDQQRYNLVMAKRPASKLSLIQQLPDGKRKYVRTKKLLCGRSGAHVEPWLVMVERLTDSIFVVQLPVKADNLASSYKEGRSMIFLDTNDYHMVMSYNSEEAYAVAGEPDDYDVWTNDVAFQRTNAMRGQKSAYEVPDYDGGSIYFYPQFLFTLDELQMLASQSDRLARLAVDTQAGDNYWLVYPMDGFGKELQKILTKLTKK